MVEVEAGMDTVSTETARIQAIWNELFRTSDIGPDADFFMLGGDSLLALRFLARANHDMHVSLGLRDLMQARTPRALGRLVEAAPTAPSLASLVGQLKASDNEPFPLTSVQQAYWIGRRSIFELGSRGTASYVEFDVPNLDIDRLRSAVDALVARHGMLRTVLLADGTQVTMPEAPPFPLSLDEYPDANGTDRDTLLSHVRSTLADQDIDPHIWPLFRLHVTRTARLSRVHLLMELLVCDAASVRILMKELFALYHHPDQDVAPLNFDFGRYARVLSQLRETATFDRDRLYWQRRVADMPGPPDLPLGRDPRSIEKPVFNRRACRLEPDAWSSFKRSALEHGLTPTSAIAAAYAETLARFSRTPRFTLNVTTYQRLPVHPDVDRLVGDFTSVTLLEVDASQPSLVALACALQKRLWEDMDHGTYSGVDVMRDVRRRDGHSLGAAMPVVFTSMLGGEDDDGGDAAREWLGQGVFGAAGTPQVWIDSQVNEFAGALEVRWDCVEALFPEGVLDSMFDRYANRLAALADHAGSWTAPKASPGASSRPPITANTLDPQRTFASIFLNTMADDPDAIACEDESTCLTRRELAEAVEEVAANLLGQGVVPREPVAVSLPRTNLELVSLLALARLGCAYVAIDTKWPVPRWTAAMHAAGATRLLVTEPIAAAPAHVQQVVARRGTDRALPPCPMPSAGDVAYVIFTSGTTGDPKGVVVEYGAAVNTLDDINARFAVGPHDRVIALSALTFDLSVYDLFGSLAAGARLVYPAKGSGIPSPDHWARCLVEHGVTVWNSAPTLVQLLLERREAMNAPPYRGLRLVMLSGDWIPLNLIDRLRVHFPSARIISLGGATEASIWSIWYEIGEVDPAWRSIPYGRPLSGQTVHVLDERLDDVEDWVAGELFIGGAGLARGYAGDQRLTAMRFIETPDGRRLHRTGDIARRRPDGVLELLGRVDEQVKVRGIRMQPREIEWALARHADVAAAAVVPVRQGGITRLAAFVVANPDVDVSHDYKRLRFLLGDAGRRRLHSAEAVALPHPPDHPPIARRTTRRFLRTPVSITALAAWLGVLRAHEVPGAPLPKYAYPSAGSLYPVQLYLSVDDGAVAGLGGGVWYYDRRSHHLRKTADEPLSWRAHAPINQSLVRDASCVAFLVGAMDAIEPVYADHAAAFVMLEAGHMAQLLAGHATADGLGTCAIGTVDDVAVRAACAVGDRDIVLHAIAMGVPDPTGQAGDPALSTSKRRVEPLRIENLRGWLRGQLPAELTQMEIHVLDGMPTTTHGKIDRDELARIATSRSVGTRHEPASNDTERRLLRIWHEVAGTDELSVDDTLLDQGADSLLLIRMHGRVAEEMHPGLPLEAMFEHASIRSLAALIRAEQPA